MNNYLVMFLGGFLGIILHMLYKVRKINSRLPNETYRSVFKEYWRKDWVSACISINVVFICMFVSSEYLNIPTDSPSPVGIVQTLQYKLALYVKSTFVVIGFLSELVVYATLGVAEVNLRKRAEDAGVKIR